MTFLYEHFRATYTPPATTITFTYQDDSEGDPENKYVFDAHALAAISPLFRNIPPPPNGIFEINQQSFIKTGADAQCFLAMCKVPPQQWSGENMNWNYKSFYAASRLCDFLGIEAELVVRYYHHDFLQTQKWKDVKAAAIRVVFHLISIRTHNQHNRKYMERVILQAWQTHQGTNFIDADFVVDEYHPRKSDRVKLQNDTQYALYSLYYLFIRCCDDPSITAVSEFMTAELGWGTGDPPYGYMLH